MKTLKGLLIAAFVGLALMSFAQSECLPACEEMPLKKALLNSVIVQAMHNQLNADLVLGSEHQGLYRASVVVNKRTIVISGTYAEWRTFFNSEGIDASCGKNKPYNPFGNKGKPYNPFGKWSSSLFGTRSGS